MHKPPKWSLPFGISGYSSVRLSHLPTRVACGLDWNGTEKGPMTGSCEDDNEHPCSIKAEKYLSRRATINFWRLTLQHEVMCLVAYLKKEEALLRLEYKWVCDLSRLFGDMDTWKYQRHALILMLFKDAVSTAQVT
jgi:hypothetical protein